MKKKNIIYGPPLNKDSWLPPPKKEEVSPAILNQLESQQVKSQKEAPAILNQLKLKSLSNTKPIGNSNPSSEISKGGSSNPKSIETQQICEQYLAIRNQVARTIWGGKLFEGGGGVKNIRSRHYLKTASLEWSGTYRKPLNAAAGQIPVAGRINLIREIPETHLHLHWENTGTYVLGASHPNVPCTQQVIAKLQTHSTYLCQETHIKPGHT